MAVDFRQHLKINLDDVKRPPPLPPGSYYAIITKYEFGEVKNENKTAYCRFHYKLTGPGDDVDPATLEGIDLSKRIPRKDYYLTQDSYWRLKEALVSLGIPTEGRELEEALVDTTNMQVMLRMIQTPAKNPTDPPYSEVDAMVAPGA